MSFAADWEELCTFLNKWYYKPDTEGLRIILCTYLSHFYLSSPPVWLTVIGLPGSGKTEIGINPLRSLGGVKSISTLTTNSLLSGYGEDNGILDQLPKSKDGRQNGIFTYPDLTTTLLSENQFDRVKIMGILRRIHDGEYDKDVGNKKKTLLWKGKITSIAAATPEIEEFWSLNRDLGERWISIRWSFVPTYAENKIIATYAKKHEGNEKEISEGLKNRIHSLINLAGSGPDGLPNTLELEALGSLLEESRSNVKRVRTNSGYQVSEVGNKQWNTRAIKSFAIIAKSSAALRNSDIIEDEDIQLARRMALDSIPVRRHKVINTLLDFPEGISKQDMSHILKFPRSTFDLVLEDMRYLNIIQVDNSNVQKEVLDDLIDTSESDENTPYGYKKPKKDAVIRFHEDYMEILKDSGLVSTAYKQKA